MAALSDYLESGILNHIFRGTVFPKPSSIAIALTSGVPVDSDSGFTMPELPSGVARGSNFITTNYKRVNLFNPATSGNLMWNNVGVDATTAYSVNGVSTGPTSLGGSGFFYPLYLSNDYAKAIDKSDTARPDGFSYTYTFSEFPNVNFYAPESRAASGLVDPGYMRYEGNGFIKNANQFVFDTAFTDWGWVSGVAVMDTTNHGSGNMLMYARLLNPRYVYAGDNIKFDAGSLEISLK